ncbi:hypothetical protein F4780DRAFT_475619 [Xylariomycetidae sp. FL0641]|nr:hypothetical protein F4780DRAFT_475619 [Xylariomycetidae sp. FL0641]
MQATGITRRARSRSTCGPERPVTPGRRRCCQWNAGMRAQPVNSGSWGPCQAGSLPGLVGIRIPKAHHFGPCVRACVRACARACFTQDAAPRSLERGSAGAGISWAVAGHDMSRHMSRHGIASQASAVPSPFTSPRPGAGVMVCGLMRARSRLFARLLCRLLCRLLARLSLLLSPEDSPPGCLGTCLLLGYRQISGRARCVAILAACGVNEDRKAREPCDEILDARQVLAELGVHAYAAYLCSTPSLRLTCDWRIYPGSRG